MNQRILIGFSIASLAAMAASVLHTAASQGRNQPGIANVSPSRAAQRELDQAAAAIDAIEASTLAAGSQGRNQPGTPNVTPSRAAQRELDQTAAAIDAIEASTLAEMRNKWNSMSPYDRMVKLGRVLLYDKHLSVNNNTACTFCHTEETGFTGPSSVINQTLVAYPGSTRSRHGQRKPQSYGYAPFAPVLHRDSAGTDFVGGNFWDMRATGTRLGNPAAEQAQDPPLDPNEMGFRDSACVVYRMSKQPYRPYFEAVWGANAFQIQWPADVEQVCDTVWDGAGGACAPNSQGAACLHLAPADRAMSDRTYDAFASAIAVNESSPEVSPFSSKFDYHKAGKAQLSPRELNGLALFNGKARCHQCHSSEGTQPLFTDFTAANLGVPNNPAVPPGPVKAYMHNGYFKSLKEVVHFYNTRDALPRCGPNDRGEKVACWPPPAVALNMNTTEVGRLGLTGREEDDIVAFLKTLTDGYK